MKQQCARSLTILFKQGTRDPHSRDQWGSQQSNTSCLSYGLVICVYLGTNPLREPLNIFCGVTGTSVLGWIHFLSAVPLDLTENHN